MNNLVSKAKDVYRRLPPSAYGVAASAYGWYLRWWRYGSDTERLVEAALARESWSADRWRGYQDGRLAELLHRAATRVPFYRDHWQARRTAGDDASWEELSNWPVLRKDSLRADPGAFLADDVNPSRLFRLSTSGTSGSPITTWRSRRTMRAWYALFEARTRHWYGVDRTMPWAILGGQLVVPAERSRPPFWVWNAGLRQLYLSTMHLAPTNAEAYVAALERHGIRYLYGYASSMYWLARMLQERGLRAPRLEVAISNAEPLMPHQRELVGEVFQCPVRDTYGMSEIVAAATECDHGEMHLWPDAGVIEVFDDDADRPVAPGVSGRFICTGLLNDDMPLIRYEVGDRGALSEAEAGEGACGRSLPRLEQVEGRVTDNLLTADGRRVFWINPVFYELPVREAQVVQESIDEVVVRLVPDVGYDESVSDVVKRRMRERMGAIRVNVVTVPRIARGPNGKFKAVVNRLDAAT